ncbi:MAG: hypothetical protein QOG90_61 [Actinomycetota bacterium]|jgi:hypothetical protein
MRRKLFVGCVAVAVVGAVVGFRGMTPAAATTQVFPLGFTSYTVPSGVTSITFDVYGGQGGPPSVSTYGGVGGLGGHTGGTLAVSPGDKFDVYVGAGATGRSGAEYGGDQGGQNGCQCPPRDGGGGGGASFVFSDGSSVPLFVAGGGGGAAPGGSGGAGGGGNDSGGNGSVPTGTTNGNAATGGTSSAGGTGGTQADTSTSGSNGGDGSYENGGAGGTDYNSAGGGGGGGLYGGGGGGGGFLGGSGGGGSGYVDPSATDVIAEDGVQAGDGLVIVTTGARPSPTTTTSSTSSTSSTSTTSTTSTTTRCAKSVTVTVPNGGESWARGSAQRIAWSFRCASGKTVRIVLLRNGSAVKTITSSTGIGSAGHGSYLWSVPGTLTAATNYRVKVVINGVSPAVADTSNANFAIT